MTDKDQLIADVIAAAGGTVVGRVRLQKLFYLLDQLGLGSGFGYEYHHYGPYSSELMEAIADATAFQMISEKLEQRASDGVNYSIYCADSSSVREDDKLLGCMDRVQAVTALEELNSQTSTVLELAATIHWLRHHEVTPDWKDELRHRKGVKADGGRMERAEDLLHKLGLDN
jgi:uncharacterized protein YwgA